MHAKPLLLVACKGTGTWPNNVTLLVHFLRMKEEQHIQRLLQKQKRADEARVAVEKAREAAKATKKLEEELKKLSQQEA